MKIILIPLISFLSRLAGGGFFAPKLKEKLNFDGAPEIAFGFALNLPWLLSGHWLVYILASLWSYAWMETGHGTVMTMGKDPSAAQSGRKVFLSRVVDPICAKFGFKLGGWQYCWMLFGLKGFLIGLPLAPWGLMLAVLWPLSYFIANRVFSKNEIAEYLTGAFAGLTCCLMV